MSKLINFPDETDNKIWVKHNNIANIKGDIYFLYHELGPRIVVAKNVEKKEIIKYLSDKELFSVAPQYLIIENKDKIDIFYYKEGGYSTFLDSLDWNVAKNCSEIEITRYAAQKIVERVAEDATNWLKHPRSQGAINAIRRFFIEPTTFIYELIQNAFDCKAKKIKIDIEKSVLKFSHNGNVFTEADVASISSVNLSTKDKNRIGFMGIGFKSVFEASEKPQIHSGPFSFYFDATNKLGGKIIPINIDQKEIYDGYTTLIYMPIKEDEFENIKKSIEKFPVKTILNLVKEELIERKNEISGINQIITPNAKINIKKGKVANSYYITYSENGKEENIETWLKFESSFKTGEKESKEFLESREIINENLNKGWNETVSITIPLIEKDGKFRIKPYKGVLNVYLPTKIQINSNFDLQGNFIVDGGRNFLNNKEGPWNSKLFKEIPNLIIKTLEWAKNEVKNKDIDLNSFYSLIPEWENLCDLSTDMSRSLKEEFRNILNSKKLIPFEEEKVIDFAYPSSCISINKPLINLFSLSELCEIYKKKIVSNILEEEVKEKLISCSDIEKIKLAEFLNIFQEKAWANAFPSLKNKLTTSINIHKWFSKLYSYIYNQLLNIQDANDYSKILKLIENSYIFLVKDEKQKKEIWINKYLNSKELVRLQYENSQLPIEIFDKKINIFSQSFYDHLRGRTPKLTNEEKEDNQNSMSLLDKINITELKPRIVISKFIIPFFQETRLFEKKKLIEATAYICNNIKDATKEDVTKCRFLNKHGEIVNPEQLFFSKEYGYEDLEAFFEKQQRIFLSPDYLEKKSISIKDWIHLFEIAGIKSKLDLKEEFEILDRNELQKKIGKKIENIYPSKQKYTNEYYPGGKYLYTDYNFSDRVIQRLKEIENLHITKRKEFMKIFMRILNKNWGYYSDFIKIDVKYLQSYETYVTIYKLEDCSKFGRYILEKNWVPVFSEEGLRIPKEVIKLTDENRSMYNEGIALCEVEVNNNFAEFLKLKSTPDNITVIDRLINLKRRGIKDPLEYAEKYKLICQDINENKLKESEIREIFRKEKLIFADDRFWSPEDIIYSPPKAFTRFFPNLEGVYPDEKIKNFFCDTLGCSEKELTIEHAITYLTEYVWKDTEDISITDTFRSSLVTSYLKIVDFLNENKGKTFLEESKWKKLIDNAKLFCKNRGWVSINSNKIIIYRTSTKYEKEFLKIKDLCIESHFIRLNKDLNTLKPLLDLFNVIAEPDKITEKFNVGDNKRVSNNLQNIERNLEILFNAIKKVLEKENEEAPSNEKNEIKTFLENLIDISRKRIIVYDVNEIKAELSLESKSLFEIKKHSHINNLRKEIEIYLTKDILDIYSSIGDELFALLKTNNLPGEIRRTIEDLIKGSIAKLNTDINDNIESFLIEQGYKEKILEEDKDKKDIERTNIKEIKEIESITESIQVEVIPNDRQHIKENISYEEITEPLNMAEGSIEEVKEDELESNRSSHSTVFKSKKSNKNKEDYTNNSHSKNDGDRGELWVFKKEKERLKKIGLDEYIPKVYYIAKDIPDNPWDIESFDILNGQTVPIRIEVKSTTSPDNYSFPMSAAEFNTALNDTHEKGRYIIYRVFNVRKSVPPIKRFDFKEKYDDKSIIILNKEFTMDIIKKD